MSDGIYHIHGGYSADRAERLGVKPEKEVIDLSVNTNPLGPPPEAVSAIKQNAHLMERYPTVDGSPVVEFYCQRFGLQRESVVAGCGSMEFIYLLPQALKPESAAIVVPTFYNYWHGLYVSGVEEPEPIGLEPARAFELEDPSPLVDRARGHSMLWLCRPNNPTGTMIAKDAVVELLKQLPDTTIVVDETFIQFCDDFPTQTLMPHTSEYKNLVVLHSLTKFYCLAGLRVGALVAHPTVAERLKGVKPPWTVNTLAEVAVEGLMGCKDYEARTRSLISLERRRIREEFKALAGVELFGGTANFFLARLEEGVELDTLLRQLLVRGIYVRDCSNFSGLGQGYFRFAIGLPEQNHALLIALKEILSGCG